MQPISKYGHGKYFDLLHEQQHQAFDQCPATQYFLSCIVNRSGTFCPNSDALVPQFDRRVAKSLQESWHTLWTIMPIVFCFAIALLTSRSMFPMAGRHTKWRFLLEFLISTMPTILCVNVLNWAVEYIVLICTFGLCFLLQRTQFWQQVWGKNSEMVKYDLGGNRPHTLTLARTTTSMLTVLCILAVDFESFPKGFRKSRRFGAALMDTGIGLFAFSMGSVSRPLKSFDSFLHLLRYVIPVLLLGLARTIVIIAIDYHQDEHEYGMHLNAFFTLGLTKLCGSIMSAAAQDNKQLLLLGLGVAAMHELALQYGMSDFVMAKNLKRNTFVRANREGICSLPGFIAIYILSMCFGKWLRTNNEGSLSLKQLFAKFFSLAIICSTLWMLVFSSIAAIGIARVTCNFGYICWILAIALTMILIFMFVFDFVLKETNTSKQMANIPLLVEVLNYNGLIYFLIANILTGMVNIFLKPESRTSTESFFILLVYMLLSAVSSYVLYIFKLKIA